MNKKEKLLRKLNKAFANNDTNTILQLVTKDIKWQIVGEKQFEGIAAFRNAVEEMKSEEPYRMVVENIFSRGSIGVAEGKMSAKGGKTYAFSDIYIFNKSNNPKVKEIRSYVLELKEEKVSKKSTEGTR